MTVPALMPLQDLAAAQQALLPRTERELVGLLAELGVSPQQTALSDAEFAVLTQRLECAHCPRAIELDHPVTVRWIASSSLLHAP